MDPSFAVFKRQGNKASESTTCGGKKNYDCRKGVAWVCGAYGVARGSGQSLGGAARILGGGSRIFNILEMRHLFGTKMEKAAWLLLE